MSFLIDIDPDTMKEDFILPDDWFILEGAGLYRNIKHNDYSRFSGPVRTICEETPVCRCLPEIGCNADCENRILYM